MTASNLFIGLMSGTSLDSIDAALINLGDDKFEVVAAIEYAIPDKLRQQLIDLCQPGDNEIDRMGVADNAMGVEFAKAALQLLAKCNVDKEAVVAIGSHGQTIRHRPDFDNAFTLQIGDPNVIAYNTGITTVADFRRRNMAAKGQGAPLAPAFHRAAFRSQQHDRAIINIGGIANITYLGTDGQCFGFDTGPGNILMDGWIQQNTGENFDRDGAWAHSGNVIDPLLQQLLSHPYLARQYPKSTGREDFHPLWLEQLIHNDYQPNDIQATLLEFTARTICNEIEKLPGTVNEIYICGGGAYNTQLMLRMENLTHPRRLASTSELGIPAQWIEAAAFAWLAQQTLEKKPIELMDITGSETDVILGAVYF